MLSSQVKTICVHNKSPAVPANFLTWTLQSTLVQNLNYVWMIKTLQNISKLCIFPNYMGEKIKSF